MKSASSIIKHIKHLPQFKLLNSHYCYNKFISYLNPRFQKAIAFAYIKKDTLFIALSHPGYKMELNSNQDLLKSILSMVIKMDEKCKNLKASKIVLFNSKIKSVIQNDKKEDTIPRYKERSTDEFDIRSEDKDIIEAFEKIKDSIKRNS
jgi:hypothetical protein